MDDSEMANFGVVDYSVFLVMLVASLGIGFYHCVRGNRTTDEFLLAGRSMSAAPIALSLTATLISSIAILGFTGEVYGHGIQLIWCCVGETIGFLIAIHVFVPVIYPLKLDSINEYLERRFRSTLIKRMVMLMTSVSSLLYLGVCLYAPTLALESVTPIKAEAYIVMLGLIVTLYSSFGGMKAVVWTDAFQAIFLMLGVILALVSATVVAGGPAQVWKTASEHGRADTLDFRVGLFVRHTALNTMMKNTIITVAQYSFHQTTVQRLATLKSLRQAKTVLYLNMLGVVGTIFLLFLGGLSIFAAYAGCDPITRGLISRKDQILPFFIMDHLGFLMGMPGIFVACLLCGTMSSISSYLNSLPTMLWKDFFAQLPFFQRATERVRTLTTKLLTAVLGLTMMGLAFLASRMGGLIQANNTLLGILNGPNAGIFFLGICVPFCNKKGAIAGTLSALIFMAWLGIGMQLHAPKPSLLPLDASHCPAEGADFNATLPIETSSDPNLVTDALELSTPGLDKHEDVSTVPFEGFYRISYTFLPFIGASACIVVGIAVSLITGRENLDEVAPELILPCLRKYLKQPPAARPELGNLLGLQRIPAGTKENSPKKKSGEKSRSEKSLL